LCNNLRHVSGQQITFLGTLPMPELVEEIRIKRNYALLNNIDFKLVIEAGWLNATKNYHGAINKAVAARIGANVGENAASGKILVDFMTYHKIPYILVKPTSAKWNADLFKKITGYTKRTNQEERDALKLVWGM